VDLINLFENNLFTISSPESLGKITKVVFEETAEVIGEIR
jgi:hypothetical protein